MNINREKRKLREISSMKNVRFLPTEKNVCLLHAAGYVIVHKPNELEALRLEQSARHADKAA